MGLPRSSLLVACTLDGTPARAGRGGAGTRGVRRGPLGPRRRAECAGDDVEGWEASG
jgi:hypothetical protein